MTATPPTYPIVEPFGLSAGGSFITLPIPVASQIGTDAGAASFTDGFPPATMTEEVAGGIPPYGQDMNGILYMISSVAAYLNAGNLYPFSSTVSAAISGYAKGSILTMADGTGFWISLVDNNTANPDTAGTNWAPMYGYGHASVAVTNADVQLTPVQNSKDVIVISGVLTANVRVNVLPTEKSWLIVNNTTGAFTVNVGVAGGGFLAIPAGGYSSPTSVYFNATANNINPTVSPLSVPISIPATPNSIAERNGTGQLLATFFNASNAVEVPAIGSVVVQNTAADGYLRKISAANFISQLGLAKLASPILTGVPAAPTAAPGTNTTQLATTAFVAALGALKANALNAVLTGIPNAPTAAAGTNNTQLATTAFVNANAGVLTPGANGSLRLGQFIVNWGIRNNASTGPEAVSFTTNYPTACVGVFAQSSGAQHTTNVTSVTQTGFNLTAGVGGQPTFWHSIGY